MTRWKKWTTGSLEFIEETNKYTLIFLLLSLLPDSTIVTAGLFKDVLV